MATVQSAACLSDEMYLKVRSVRRRNEFDAVRSACDMTNAAEVVETSHGVLTKPETC